MVQESGGWIDVATGPWGSVFTLWIAVDNPPSCSSSSPSTGAASDPPTPTAAFPATAATTAIVPAPASPSSDDAAVLPRPFLYDRRSLVRARHTAVQPDLSAFAEPAPTPAPTVALPYTTAAPSSPAAAGTGAAGHPVDTSPARPASPPASTLSAAVSRHSSSICSDALSFAEQVSATMHPTASSSAAAAATAAATCHALHLAVSTYPLDGLASSAQALPLHNFAAAATSASAAAPAASAVPSEPPAPMLPRLTSQPMLVALQSPTGEDAPAVRFPTPATGSSGLSRQASLSLGSSSVGDSNSGQVDSSVPSAGAGECLACGATRVLPAGSSHASSTSSSLLSTTVCGGAAAELTAATRGGGSETSLSVLLVDDDAAIQRLAGRVLRRLGLMVTVRGDGYEAVAAVKADPHRYDLVLLDIGSGLGMVREEGQENLACEASSSFHGMCFGRKTASQAWFGSDLALAVQAAPPERARHAGPAA